MRLRPRDIGALLRREGIHPLQVATWRKLRQVAGPARMVKGQARSEGQPGNRTGSLGCSIAG
jgi:hypothetical protein